MKGVADHGWFAAKPALRDGMLAVETIANQGVIAAFFVSESPVARGIHVPNLPRRGFIAGFVYGVKKIVTFCLIAR